ncbi:acyltransferase [Pontibacter sp. H249]|uniref:acyltransferase n=1 Tax=Pontibacter sp. H249 TaxID=3133420 RepID=UPI0030C458E7
MMKVISMLKYPYLSKIIIPFKVYQKSFIRIRKRASISLMSRVVLGSNSELPTISRIPINLYFGKDSKTYIGESVSIGPGVSIVVKDKAKLSIGNKCFFTSNMYIEVLNKLEIGNDVGIAWGVSIIDKNQHNPIYSGLAVNSNDEVKIGNHVWIGCNVTILPGTVIGNNSIVAANSVVKGVFKDNCLIGGNPAKIIREDVSFNW